MPFCSECGTKNDDGARFCEECGKAISVTPSYTSSAISVPSLSTSQVSTGSKLSFGGASLALLCFFLPWLKACDASMSGLDLVIQGPTREFGAPQALLILIIPLSAAFIIWSFFKVIKGQTNNKTVGTHSIIVSISSLVVLLGTYVTVKQKFRGFPYEVFTFWFLLTILSFVTAAIGGYMNKNSDGA
ncbi:MAG: zinc-ribbon domain-containing protein [Nitrospirota bacterium]